MSQEMPADARCLRCGYRLVGLPHQVCPECGRPFRPDDSNTFTLPGEWHWPHIPEPPPGWHTAMALLISLAYLYWSSVPGGLAASLWAGACFLVPLGIGVLAVFGFEHVARAWAIWRERRWAPSTEAPSFAPFYRWLAVPLSALLILSGMFTFWPLRVRFHLAKPHFENAVSLYQTGADPRVLSGDYEFLKVRHVFQYPNGALFFCTGSAGFDSVGVIFSPVDRPPGRGDVRLARYWIADMQ